MSLMLALASGFKPLITWVQIQTERLNHDIRQFDSECCVKRTMTKFTGISSAPKEREKTVPYHVQRKNLNSQHQHCNNVRRCQILQWLPSGERRDVLHFWFSDFSSDFAQRAPQFKWVSLSFGRWQMKMLLHVGRSQTDFRYNEHHSRHQRHQRGKREQQQ